MLNSASNKSIPSYSIYSSCSIQPLINLYLPTLFILHSSTQPLINLYLPALFILHGSIFSPSLYYFPYLYFTALFSRYGSISSITLLFFMAPFFFHGSITLHSSIYSSWLYYHPWLYLVSIKYSWFYSASMALYMPVPPPNTCCY